MIIKKKGQAAMEFLMTYGWAILAAIIVVGVLWYIIGNPGNLAGNKFALSAPLTQNAMALNSTGLTLEFRNGAGNSINITGVDFSAATCTDLVGVNINVSDGQLGKITTTCTLNTGDRFNSDVTFKYITSGSSITQQSTGTVSARVP